MAQKILKNIYRLCWLGVDWREYRLVLPGRGESAALGDTRRVEDRGPTNPGQYTHIPRLNAR